MWGHTCCLTQKHRCSQVQVHGRGGGGPLLPLVALAGPCIPGLGRGQRGQDLPPQEQLWDHWVLRACNFTHFRFDRSLTPTFVNVSAIKTNSQSIPTETFGDSSPQKTNWFHGVPNSVGGVGQCLMNGVPGVDGVQLGTILGQNSLLISSSGEKLWRTARSCETTLERGGDGGQLRLSKTMVFCGKLAQSSVDAIATQ